MSKWGRREGLWKGRGVVDSARSEERTLIVILLLGLGAMAWAGYSLVTGKGNYKGCPPGGYDRDEDPFNYWAPTIVLLCIGIFAVLVFFGVIPLPARGVLR